MAGYEQVRNTIFSMVPLTKPVIKNLIMDK